MSGGQTGVDRAALDAARRFNMPCGGWCPRGRRAEDGRIPAEYPLKETSSYQYQQRTRYNVRDSDGTLIITQGEPRGGTGLTANLAAELARPLLVVDVRNPDIAAVDTWLSANEIQTLNVAGPRESQIPGVYTLAYAIVSRVLNTSSR